MHPASIQTSLPSIRQNYLDLGRMHMWGIKSRAVPQCKHDLDKQCMSISNITARINAGNVFLQITDMLKHYDFDGKDLCCDNAVLMLWLGLGTEEMYRHLSENKRLAHLQMFKLNLEQWCLAWNVMLLIMSCSIHSFTLAKRCAYALVRV